MYDIVYLAPFGTKFITDLIQLIGSTRPKSAQIRCLVHLVKCSTFGSGLSLTLQARYLGTRKLPIPTRSWLNKSGIIPQLARRQRSNLSYPFPKPTFCPKWEVSVNVDCKTVRIFAYSSTREQSNKRSGTRLKIDSETGERRKFFLSPHTPYGRVRLARFARVRRLRHALPTSLMILRKKSRLFCSLVLLLV